jgi:uncharacterized protein
MYEVKEMEIMIREAKQLKRYAIGLRDDTHANSHYGDEFAEGQVSAYDDIIFCLNDQIESLEEFMAEKSNNPNYNQEEVGDYIATYSGHKFYVSNPRAVDVNIEDIAHALAHSTRFTGHTKEKFYSVGEHSVYACILAEELGLSKRVQAIALLHDASEAYCGDLNRPLKQTLPQYKEAEDKIMNAIWERYLDTPPTEEEYNLVKKIDNTLLLMEMKQLMYREDDLPELEHFEVEKEFNMSLRYSFDDIKNAIHMDFKNLVHAGVIKP